MTDASLSRALRQTVRENASFCCEVSEIKVSSAQGYEAGVGTRPHAVRDADGWLCPVDVNGDSEASAGRNRDRRASNKGYLPTGTNIYKLSQAGYEKVDFSDCEGRLDWGRANRGKYLRLDYYH